MSENIDAPDGWHWGSGSRSSSYYTHWLYSNLRFHYQAEMYWDEGQQHTVHFYEEKGLLPCGSVDVSEYPCERGSFETEEEALEFLKETADKLLDYE